MRSYMRMGIAMGQRHYAQVARLRIETAIIEFDADPDDVEGAQKIAEEKAKRLPQSSWQLEPFNADDQAPFALSIVDETEFEEAKELDPMGTVDPYEMADVIDEIRFVLLSGNLDTAEGEIIGQPWLATDPPNLLISDIARDWIDKLEALGLTDLSDRLDELREGEQPMPSDLVRFGAAKKMKKPPPSSDD
jgi:hypothetical protein